MTSVLSAAGKYRPRKDWSTNSIPQLVALDEEESTHCDSILSSTSSNGTTTNGVNKTTKSIATVQLPPIKPPRRSSLAMGLLTGRGGIDKHKNSNDLITNNEKNTKRRSSIAIAFLGRSDNSHKSKEYDPAVVLTNKIDRVNQKIYGNHHNHRNHNINIINNCNNINNRGHNSNSSNNNSVINNSNNTKNINQSKVSSSSSTSSGAAAAADVQTTNILTYNNENNIKKQLLNNKKNNVYENNSQLVASTSSSNKLLFQVQQDTSVQKTSTNYQNQININDNMDTTVVNTENIPVNNNNNNNDDDENNVQTNIQSGDDLTKINDGFVFDKEKRRRRSSWHAKLERRRRKISTANQMDDICDVDDLPQNDIINENDTTLTGGNSSYDYNNRQKRHSWWNIFVPDNLKQRSRRASQDVGVLSRSDENIIPFRRSKSRSVDHGLAAPFDLDSLRSKVEGRFESIDRLTKDGDKKKLPMPIIPTISYTVGDHDTLTSVAARFDTTPSELTALNRLASSFIYSGQHLLVPDKSGKDNDNASSTGEGSQHSGTSSPEGGRHRKGSTDDLPQEEKELLEGLRPGSPKPGHIERISSPHTQNDDDPVITQRFLKINVRHITDGQGVVGGVLLVTPNAVMFDPNVSDPLVIEHGPESYGVIAPMELVVNAAIFHDIAHMRVGGGESQSTEKPEIYHPKSCSRCENTHSPGKDSLLVKDETFPELGMGSVEACDDQESVCSSNEREGDAFPKAFERDLVTPTNLQQKSQGETLVNGGDNKTGGNEQTKDKLDTATEKEKSDTRTLEERRRSLIDHHWAVPSKDRSLDDEDETGAAKPSDGDSGGVANSVETDSAIKIPLVTSVPPELPPSIVAAVAAAAAAGPIDEDNSQLVKLSCHDSGIDIRDPNSLPTVPAIPTKKVYSDADIVLSSEWVPPLTIAPSHFTDTTSTNKLSTQSSLTSTTAGLSDGGRKKTTSVSFSIEDGGDSINNIMTEKVVGEKKNKMLKRLSYPLTWVEGLTGEGNKSSESSDSAPNTGDSNQSVFSKVFSSSPITLVSEFGGNLFLSKTPSEDSGGSPVPPLTPFEGSNSGAGGHMAIGRSSIGTFIRPHSESGSSQNKPLKPTQPRLDYRSMVSIDDMPELFASFDKLIPRPARACPDPPLYLRLRMGRLIGKAIPLPTSVMSYGKNKLRPEYWFSIPKNRVDELYRFLNSWVPQLYGELDEEHVTARGYELIQHDTEFTRSGSPTKDGRSNSDGEITELTRESWEVLSMSTDDYRKASLFAPGSFDQDFPIPELIGQTEILTEEHREKLCGHLPARAEGYSWSLVFSTSLHGFSLNSLYRKMQRLESPVLIVIQDTDNNVFGALTSCSLHVSDHFYGTGESLLYKFNPSFKVFHWSGENLYFIKGNPESLAIGAGDGIFGLWLDGDLNLGRSQRCSTYSNEPLSPQEDFVVKTLECWAFV